MQVETTPNSNEILAVGIRLITPTADELAAKERIQVAGMVKEFVAYFKKIRPKAQRHLFYMAFNPNLNDSPLLKRVREAVVNFAETLDQQEQDTHRD